MMTREAARSREQLEMLSLDDLAEPLYCGETGRPSLDPVALVKLPTCLSR